MSLELTTSRLRIMSHLPIFQGFTALVPHSVPHPTSHPTYQPHRESGLTLIGIGRPFSQHGTLDRSLFVGFNRNDVSLLHLVERGCCGYTIAEVRCAFGSLSAYVCYPQGITFANIRLYAPRTPVSG